MGLQPEYTGKSDRELIEETHDMVWRIIAALEQPSRKLPKKKFVPPSVAEAEAHTKAKGFPGLGKEFVEHFNGCDWVDRDGRPVLNWKSKLNTWIKYREKNKEDKDKGWRF